MVISIAALVAVFLSLLGLCRLTASYRLAFDFFLL